MTDKVMHKVNRNWQSGGLPTSNPVLEVKDLSLKYKTRAGLLGRSEHTVLENVSFKLYEGETLGIVGRNGCGKSSLLRVLAGVINPTDGEVVVAPGLHRALLTIGLGFKPDLTGRDNALLSMMLQGTSKAAARAQLDDINEFAELGEFFDQPLKTYSAGMRARLGFSTAFKTKIDVMLIDEALSVGDVAFRRKAEAALTERIQGRQTVVLVSHNVEQLKKLCTRALLLETPSIRCEGDIDTVWEKYCNPVSFPVN